VSTHERLAAAIAAEPLPAAVLDLAAFDRNLDRHVALTAASKKPLRVATKSVRSPALLRWLAARGGDALRGLMCWSVPEAEKLAAEGFDDLLVAYPPSVREGGELARAAVLAASGKRLYLAVDHEITVRRAAEEAKAKGAELALVICVDMSYELLGGRVHLGVRRSPLRGPAEVVRLARRIAETPGVRFAGLLCYEAQIAGLGDASPFARAQNPVKALIRRVSAREVAERRGAIVGALRDAGLPPELVNGGGTGSLDTTSPEPWVTEVTAGSGFYKPHLFDYYRAPHVRALEPALFFALEVTRLPAHGWATCSGGGYVASGAAGPDRLPVPWFPSGLALSPMEGAGEVQTPLVVPEGTRLGLGDPVFFRHAKAGELCERFDRILLVEHDRIVDRVRTYRGLGWTFF